MLFKFSQCPKFNPDFLSPAIKSQRSAAAGMPPTSMEESQVDEEFSAKSLESSKVRRIGAIKTFVS